MKNKNEKENNILYMPILMSVGVSLGLAVGAAIKNIPVCMCMGIGFGLCIGTAIDAKNRNNSDDTYDKDNEDT